jgi:hypothetical protein
VRPATPQELAAVLKLDGPARVERFVKRVAGEEQAWGLWSDGWAMLATRR